MKNFKYVLMALFCAVCVSFVGCDDSDDVDAGEIADTWTCSMLEDSEAVPDAYTTIVTLCFGGNEIEGTYIRYLNENGVKTNTEDYRNNVSGAYTYSDSTWYITLNIGSYEAEYYTATISGNKMTMYSGGKAVMTLTREE